MAEKTPPQAYDPDRPAAPGLLGALARALRYRRSTSRGGGKNGTVPLRGGEGALVSRAASRRLITVATRADAKAPGRGLAGWLEKVQARRSAIVVVPDRASGVVIALRWGLNPERLRLADDFDLEGRSDTLLDKAQRRPWHNRK